MKIMAVNPVNYNQKNNAQSENSGKNPSFGMKVNLNTDLLKFTLGQKQVPAAIEVLNKIRDFAEKLNTTAKTSNVLNIDNIFNLAKQKLEIPKNQPIDLFIPDYAKRELSIEIEQPHGIPGLNISVIDGRKKLTTFITNENLKSGSTDPQKPYLTAIIHGLFEYAKKVLDESPLYRQYLQSSEHTQYLMSDEYKKLKTQKK